MDQPARDTAGELIDKLDRRFATIGVVGLGYVGLPLLLRFVEAGYRSVGFDLDASKIEDLQAGRSYLSHLELEYLPDRIRDGVCSVTADLARVAEVDALILCVPTPLDEYRQPDLRFVINSVEAAITHMHAGQVLSLESTTYPGTTNEELRPRLEQAGFRVGEDVFLVFAPEREDPGNARFATRSIPKIVSGATDHCLGVAKALYAHVVDQLVAVSSPEVAEMTKLLENTYRAVNIALVNELKIVADKMGIDIFEVIRAAATKPFGYTAFYPGPGLGGHCIPIDPFYLTWKARQYGVSTRFIELAGEVNTAMPEYVVAKVSEALNTHAKAVNGARILVIGLAYKKNVNDTRESPGAEILFRLDELGAEVAYHDPYVARFPDMRRGRLDLTSVTLTPETIGHFDCVVVVTDHDRVSWDAVHEHARLIVDPRGLFMADGIRVFRS